MRGLDPSRLAALDDDVRAELAHVFPSLSALASERRPALQHERYRSHRAVRALLERLAQTQPLVLVLDDLHWADSASIELLGALLRRPPAAPVLIALARPPAPGAGATSRLRSSARTAPATLHAHRARGACSPRRRASCSGDSVERGRRQRPLRGERRQPLLPRAARPVARRARRPASGRRGRRWPGIDVPAAVAAALAEELALLSEQARLVLRRSGGGGRSRSSPSWRRPRRGCAEAAVMDAVDELLQLDLVRDDRRAPALPLPPSARPARGLRGDAAGWRLGAHERCAEALAARGAPAAARAHHVERSAREGDVDAVAVLREAGEEAVRLAPASAARWFADALRLLPQTAPAEERVELLLARAERSDGGRPLRRQPRGAARGSRARARGRPRDCAPGSPARAPRSRASSGGTSEAGARLAGALAELPDQGSPEAVALMIELAMNAFWRARYEAMHESAERAVERRDGGSATRR